MTRQRFLALLDKVRVARSGGKRAPHKPLLLLLALARASRGERDRLASYSWFEGRLKRLLADFGPTGTGTNPSYPFWRLRNDRIKDDRLWEIPEAEGIVREGRITKSGDSHIRALREHGARGGFPPAVSDLLARDLELVHIAASLLLTRTFPESRHSELLDAVGLQPLLRAAEEPEPYTAVRKPRDPAFRRAVITAYERRCAVCGFDVRLDDRLLGIEAAHIRWHAYGGPDCVPNGLALCIFHHRALDGGAIGLQGAGDSYRLIVSNELSGGSDAFRQLVGINDQPLRPPQAPHFRPDPQFVRWHRKEVFRGEPRAA